MGHFAAGDWLPIDLSRAMAALANANNGNSPFPALRSFSLKFLLFKLMLMSGVVKLTSGDDCWWNLTALDYHYWSQPLANSVRLGGRTKVRNGSSISQSRFVSS